MRSGLTTKEREHLAELKKTVEQLEALANKVQKLKHDCNVAYYEMATGCDCDMSAGVLGEARKYLPVMSS